MISQTDGANPKGRDVNLIFMPKNCMKMKKIGPRNWWLASLVPHYTVEEEHAILTNSQFYNGCIWEKNVIPKTENSD